MLMVSPSHATSNIPSEKSSISLICKSTMKLGWTGSVQLLILLIGTFSDRYTMNKNARIYNGSSNTAKKNLQKKSE